MYDPIIGRFPSIDPKAEEFAWVSTYNYAENSPIANIDLWGLQKLSFGTHMMMNGYPYGIGSYMYDFATDGFGLGQFARGTINNVNNQLDYMNQEGNFNENIPDGVQKQVFTANDWATKREAVEGVGAYFNANMTLYGLATGASESAMAKSLFGQSKNLFNVTDDFARNTRSATNPQVLSRAARFADGFVEFTKNAKVTGTLKHSAATNFVRRYQSLFGDIGLNTRATKTGEFGRAFLDVYDETNSIIYDWKFGQPFMNNAQFLKYDSYWRLPINLIDRFGNITPR